MFFTNDHLTEIKALRVEPFDNVCDLVRGVPSYVLRTNLTDRFWEDMKKFSESSVNDEGKTTRKGFDQVHNYPGGNVFYRGSIRS
ncbi:MAG: hypothetical protein NTV99_07630 [Deltaproteobacteria bacterium]|nr:hypothetical protein [Deltaproteobacteria bacterium]